VSADVNGAVTKRSPTFKPDTVPCPAGHAGQCFWRPPIGDRRQGRKCRICRKLYMRTYNAPTPPTTDGADTD
jgi:hypothetical protein